MKLRNISALINVVIVAEASCFNRDEWNRPRPIPAGCSPNSTRFSTCNPRNIDDVCRVTICTIQRLYSILRGEDLAEDADEISGAELAASLGTRTRDIEYNPTVPIEKFDFIITDAAADNQPAPVMTLHLR